MFAAVWQVQDVTFRDTFLPLEYRASKSRIKLPEICNGDLEVRTDVMCSNKGG